MKPSSLICVLRICVLQCLTTTFLLAQSQYVPAFPQVESQTTAAKSPTNPSKTNPKSETSPLDAFGQLPLSFEENLGQVGQPVKFLSRTDRYSLFLTEDEAVLTLHGRKADAISQKAMRTAHVASAAGESKSGGVLRMKLRDANAAAKVEGLDQLAGKSNYFIGNDPAKWRTDVPNYAKVKYEGVYSGIDLVYYGNQRQLEYDFIVSPGADPRRIAFDIHGAKHILRDTNGDLVLKMSEDEIRWHKPTVYQEKNGTRHKIAARYAITDKNLVTFELASYDTRRPLYIDPLIYSTYLGGSGSDGGYAIAADSAGNTYVAGFTCSDNFPTSNALDSSYGGGSCPAPSYVGGDAFVTKINPKGTAFIYSTYLGGSGTDVAYGIAVDSAGNAYVTGSTGSSDFPTVNPLQPTNNSTEGGTAFVTEINASGSALIYSTYLGGTGADNGYGIAVGSSGNAYVVGLTFSTDFPVTPGAFQTTCPGTSNFGCWTGFVANIKPLGTALVYSTYLGGSVIDYGLGIAVDHAGDAYITGFAGSPNFPTTPGAFSTQCGEGSCETVFVTKLNPKGTAPVYSTFLGGTWWMACCAGIAIDSAGSAYVTGATPSYNFPVTPGAFQTVNNGCSSCSGVGGDAFVSKFAPDGASLVYSTYLGGSGEDGGSAIAVDGEGNAYVTGETQSNDFPVTPHALLTTEKGLSDAFVAKFNASGSALYYATYLGGPTPGKYPKGTYGNAIAADSLGNAYVTGQTASAKFPITGLLQGTYGGGFYDGFVSKLAPLAWTTTTISSSPNPSTYGQAVTFTASTTSSDGAPPDGDSVSFYKGTTVVGTGTFSGGEATFTTSNLEPGTNAIKASYLGDQNLAASVSKAVSQVVDKATTTTALASSLNPSNSGQSVTFTASVTPQFGGTIVGTVTFYDGTTLLKTVGISRGSAKFTTQTLGAGTHNISAAYNGSAGFEGSSASLTQTVN
jgi:hypothetical protein